MRSIDRRSLPATPWLIGHRGAAGEAPENTLASFALAQRQGADLIELDVQLTADEILVACHDYDLERMGQSPLEIEHSEWEEISAIDVSGPFRGQGAAPENCHIPTLTQVFELLAPVPLNVELKRQEADPGRLVRALASSLPASPTASLPYTSPLVISSFDWPLLFRVRDALPEIAIAPLGGRSVDKQALLEVADDLQAWSVHCNAAIVDYDLIAATTGVGRPLLAYTVNDAPEAVNLFDQGVSGVFTDFPGRLRDELDAHG